MKKHLLDTDVKEVDIMVGLILEGGGSRGAYTAGVLDVLAENDIYLPVTYGVSAGACNALSYLSKQNLHVTFCHMISRNLSIHQ